MSTIQLQSVGHVPAIPASEMKIGDVRMYNFGSTSLIIHVSEKTAKTLQVIEYCKQYNEYYIYDIRKTTLVAVVKSGQDVSEHKPQQIKCLSGKNKGNMIDTSEYFPAVEEPQQEEIVVEEQTEKIQTESIEFIWSESSKVSDGTIVKTYKEANNIFLAIVSDIMKNNGYCRKTEVKITFVDGNSYTLRYDVTANDQYDCNLTKRITEGLESYAGLRKPGHMTQEDYDNIIKVYGSKEQSLHLLDTYLFHDVEKVEPTQVNEAATNNNETVENEEQTTQENNGLEFEIVLNQEHNGIELHFNDKPEEAIREQLKANGFRWSNRGFWYTKQSEQRLNFAKSLQSNNSEPTVLKEAETISYPEIEIDDISNYTVDKDLQRREHDSNWITRSKETDRTTELQGTLSHYQQKALELIFKTDNERITYNIKKSLQYFKKHYSEAFVNWLRAKADNPSWITTGRGGLNKSKYEKGLSRINKWMSECAELTKGIDQRLNKYANEIRKDKEQEFQTKANNTTVDITFETKIIEVKGYSKKLRAYVYGEYWICKNWGTFRIYRNGKEIHSMKTNQSLEDAKKYVQMIISEQQNEEQKAI